MDQNKSISTDSVGESLLLARTASSTEKENARRSAVTDPSQHAESELTETEMARLHGSATPDEIDTLMAAALNTKGAFTGDKEMYEFSGGEKTFEKMGKIPSAVPRLVDCLGWDRRAAATYQGVKVLVGVICSQALIRNPKIRNLLTTLGPNGYPVVWVDYRNPSISEARKGQLEWRKLLVNQAM